MQYLANMELYCPLHPPYAPGLEQIVCGFTAHPVPGQTLLQVEDVPDPFPPDVPEPVEAPSPQMPQVFLQYLSK